MGQRKTFTPEFKREAVQLLESGSCPAFQIARNLGIKRNQLAKWQAELSTHKEAAFPGSDRRPGSKDEVSRLKHELAQVKEEQDILKKAAAYFAKELP
ncbi:MAG: transposase [Nitrospirales bacterium]|nr:MAG: transposase [Nitrospirales bacterium]